LERLETVQCRPQMGAIFAGVALGVVAVAAPVAWCRNGRRSTWQYRQADRSSWPRPVPSGARARARSSSFLAVPYAAPPVGEMRWRAPESVARWQGVRDARKVGSPCAQNATPFGVASQSEDCLFLNVFAPAGRDRPAKAKPVLVWIHGGGPSGNYGWMDQQTALRWVHRNIGSFGGDAGNVTIAGESAGGLSVRAHLVSPGSRGLFNRAIVQSGDFALNQTPLAEAEADSTALATKLGCADQTAACLRKLPVSALTTNQEFASIPGVVDGKVLQEPIGRALATGRPVSQGSGSPIPGLLDGRRRTRGVPLRVGRCGSDRTMLRRAASSPLGSTPDRVWRWQTRFLVRGAYCGLDAVVDARRTDAKDTNACTSSAQSLAGRIAARIASSGTVCEHPISAHLVSLAAYGRRA
jgi:hypothetical protein